MKQICDLIFTPKFIDFCELILLMKNLKPNHRPWGPLRGNTVLVPLLWFQYLHSIIVNYLHYCT